MTQTNILVVLPVTEEHKAKLEAAAPAAVFSYLKPAAVTPEAAKAAHIIIGNLPPEHLADSENLQWLQLNYAGIGKFANPGVLPPRTLLTNSSGAYGEAIGEYLVAMLLYLMKKLYLYRDNQQNKIWKDMGRVRTIMGSRVLVVGLGDIGLSFARRIKAMGGQVSGIRRHTGDQPDYVDQIYTLDQLDELLPQADVVAMCLPDTPLTKGLLDRQRLLAMKQGAYFLNVGRGNAVDNVALAEVLASGHLGGAAVDVIEPEPLPQDHPLWTAPNSLLTPHVAGGFHAGDILEKVVAISCDNLKRYFAGEPLLNLVDSKTGYRQKEGHWRQ